MSKPRYGIWIPVYGNCSQKGRSIIARTLLTQPVYACLDKATPEIQAMLRTVQHNFLLPFDRMGIDPFTQHFPVTLRLEGTVRGTGGIRITDYTCASTVPGLYAAGDAATRELICGGFTGGGSHNAAWATSSGYWAGEAAANMPNNWELKPINAPCADLEKLECLPITQMAAALLLQK